MNARRLHAFAAAVGELRDLARDAGDEQAAARLDQLAHDVRALAVVADRVLSQIGNPPTDGRRD